MPKIVSLVKIPTLKIKIPITFPPEPPAAWKAPIPRWLWALMWGVLALAVIVLGLGTIGLAGRAVAQVYFVPVPLVFNNVPFPTHGIDEQPKSVFKPGETVFIAVDVDVFVTGTSRSELRIVDLDRPVTYRVQSDPQTLINGSFIRITKGATLPVELAPGRYKLTSRIVYEMDLMRSSQIFWESREFQVATEDERG